MNRPRDPDPALTCDVSAEAYRQAMRQVAAAVLVITTRSAGSRNGLTATAVMSLTAEPPRIAVAVNRGASAYPMLRESGVFAANVLRYDQAAIAGRFAGAEALKGEARFEGADWTELVTGAPVLAQCLACFDCRVENVVETGTHDLLIGAVQSIRLNPTERPLLYLEGNWASLIQANGAEIEAYRDTVLRCIDTLDNATRAGGDCGAQLRRFVEDFTAVNISQTSTTREFLQREPYVAPDKLAEINAVRSRFDGALRQLIARGVADGSFAIEDEGLAALAITGMLSWVHRWYSEGGRLAPEEIGARLAGLASGMVAAKLQGGTVSSRRLRSTR